MYAYICCRWTCDGKRLQLPCQFPPLIDQRAAGKMQPCKRWSGKICRLLATSHRALWCIVSWKRNLTGFKDSGHDCNLLFISILSQPQQLLEGHIVPRCDALVLLDSRCFPPCVPLMRSETVITTNQLLIPFSRSNWHANPSLPFLSRCWCHFPTANRASDQVQQIHLPERSEQRHGCGFWGHFGGDVSGTDLESLKQMAQIFTSHHTS